MVAAYLDHLTSELQLTLVTVRLHCIAVAAVRKANGREDPNGEGRIRPFLKGIARAQGKI